MTYARFRFALLVSLATAAVGVLPARPARAGFLDAFSGNTRIGDALGTFRETINFAVLDRLTGASAAGDVFGTGLAGFDSLAKLSDARPFDTTARYLYLYQEVNNPTGSAPGGATGYGDGQSRFGGVTSLAQWTLALSDAQGIVSTTNQFGKDGVPFGPGAPANVGVVNPGVAAPDPAVSLIALTLVSTPGFFLAGHVGGFPTGGMTRLYGYTTNAAPTLLAEGVGPPSVATGTYPVPALATVPEPPSFALLGVAIGGLCLFRRVAGSR